MFKICFKDNVFFETYNFFTFFVSYYVLLLNILVIQASEVTY